MQEQRLKGCFLNGIPEDEALVRTCEDKLYSLCRKLAQNCHDADDLYQQTWLKALQKTDRFKREHFSNWLYTICLNLYRDQYRKAKRREKVTADSLGDEALEYAMATATNGVSAETEAIENCTRRLLRQHITALPEKQRLLVVLYYYAGLDYSECAQVLKVPVGTIKSRLNTAKKTLQAEMEKTQRV